MESLDQDDTPEGSLEAEEAAALAAMAAAAARQLPPAAVSPPPLQLRPPSASPSPSSSPRTSAAAVRRSGGTGSASPRGAPSPAASRDGGGARALRSGSGAASPASLSSSFASLSSGDSLSGGAMGPLAAGPQVVPSLSLVMEEAQQLEADLTAVITNAAEELGLGKEATQQLTDVLHKLEQLEQDLSAAITSTVPEAAEAAQLDALAPPPGAAAAAAAAALEARAVAADVAAAAAAAAAAAPAEPSLQPAAAPAPAPAPSAGLIDSAKLWALFVLGLSYVHQATTGFALPAMLPIISPALHLSDFQGAMLTSGYSYLYALALVPVGLLADRVSRPKLLAVGLVLWSALSMTASKANNFSDLLLTRVGFAAAQAAQNPVAFSLIPDLFPDNKSTALAAYNCAIYLGRALSFASVLAANRLGKRLNAGEASPVDSEDASDLASAAASGAAATAAASAAAPGPEPGVSLSMVPLDKLDLQRMSIIYTTGDMAAVTPVYNYNFHVIAYEAAAGGGGDGWRSLLFWLGLPGIAIAALMFVSVQEPREDAARAAAAAARQQQQQQQQQQDVAAQGRGEADGGAAAAAAAAAHGAGGVAGGLQKALGALGTGVDAGGLRKAAAESAAAVQTGAARLIAAARGGGGSAGASPGLLGGAAAAVGAAQLQAPPPPPLPGGFGGVAFSPVRELLGMRAFQATTLAAALNDLGSYALIAWHSTFYERVFGLDSSVYAPMLAVILPVGGILGGVGGGLIADVLSTVGGRYWLTSGASVLAAPFIAYSLLADTTTDSFLALLVGFAMSEAWRAPSAIMIRTIAPQELGSTASALYLCIRNLVGGAGPVMVAKLAEAVGLQRAMLLAPACYLVSGVLFLAAERAIEDQEREQRAAAAAAPQRR